MAMVNRSIKCIILLCYMFVVIVGISGCQTQMRSESASSSSGTFQGENLQYSRVHIVDKVGNNYFFRGNDPLMGEGSDRYFAYDTLISYMNQRLAEAGEQPLDDNVYLVDISLLNADEWKDLSAEKQYFLKHKRQGEFVHWSVVGDTVYTPYTKRGAKNSQDMQNNQRTNKRITTVTDMLNGSVGHGRQVVVYVHCDGGCDRTGYFVGSYLMDRKNDTYSQAIDQDNQDCGRTMTHSYVNATKWYCSYLESEGYSNICNFTG